ncbi:DUF4401 domain-containing protein [Sphingobacterium sp.]|uniref:DUF4401 domain-containing protein n=1 Tax=Sphingobacterium sp. TaxID=341027 RepID=UPI0028A5C674|nr:DUF4401 domain-containing protein [Sphingobacterium sp.]
MENNQTREALLKVQGTIGRELNVDQVAMDRDLVKDRHSQSITIKVLSVIGGILATGAFLLFLELAHFSSNHIPMLILSGIFFIASLWINKKYDRVILDTLSVCIYLLSFILFGIGYNKFDGYTDVPLFVYQALALITLLVSRSYILTFCAILISTGTFLAYFAYKEVPEFNNALLILVAVLFIYFTFNEGKLMKRKAIQGKRYLAIRTGLVFSYLICLYYCSRSSYMPNAWIIDWATSGVLIALMLWLINCLLNRFLCQESGKKIFIFLLVLICLGFTAMNPAISGSLLLLLVSFKVNYKTGFALGILAFIYFIGMFYYDLNISLLQKSIAMFVSGLFFLLLYLMIFKKSNSHEKA